MNTLQSTRVTIPVQCMTCSGCVASVTRVLKSAPGVRDAAVSLERAEAVVDIDPGLASVETLRRAVVDAGFESA